jgi:hypothetical protein
MNKVVLGIVKGLVLPVVLGSLAEAAAEPDRSYPSGGERYVRRTIEIGDDSGGFVAEYALRLYEMRETKQRVEFVGRCDSACTLFLALPVDQTCITEGAYFRFHAPSSPSAAAAAAVTAYMMNKYPKWVRAWIIAQGGLSDRQATMSFDYANKFIRNCSLTRR